MIYISTCPALSAAARLCRSPVVSCRVVSRYHSCLSSGSDFHRRRSLAPTAAVNGGDYEHDRRANAAAASTGRRHVTSRDRPLAASRRILSYSPPRGPLSRRPATFNRRQPVSQRAVVGSAVIEAIVGDSDSAVVVVVLWLRRG